MGKEHGFVRVWSALFAGAIYGLSIRIGFEAKSLAPFFQIVSTAFLVVTPFCVGAIAVLLYAGSEHISLGKQAAISAVTMMLFLVAMFATLLEGLICLVLVAPVFLIASVLGGLIAGFIHNKLKVKRSSLSAFVILPLLLGPIEANLPVESSEQMVSSSIQIQAPPEVVFDQLASVRAIDPKELGFSFVHMIGLPRPLEAEMNGAGVGSVRTSRWEKGVSFQEVIQEWDRPKVLRYRFHIPAGSIPRDALDRHVEMGGEYFTVLDGGYELTTNQSGATELKLTTHFLNKSQLKIYGDLWGKMVLTDFHQSILGLMKNRAEKANSLLNQPVTYGRD
ncbi:SRPBCC family protein [Undibacterium curvum]|uniref:SRPBCC family protein n=1 Tax=Undibacterium curvum TaxID=2762294 RepID=UPI003D0D3376